MTILHFNDVYNVEPRAKEPRDATRASFDAQLREIDWLHPE
jgi:hypothetical protein